MELVDKMAPVLLVGGARVGTVVFARNVAGEYYGAVAIRTAKFHERPAA